MQDRFDFNRAEDPLAGIHVWSMCVRRIDSNITAASARYTLHKT